MHIKRKHASRGEIVLCIGNEKHKFDFVGRRELVGAVEMLGEVSAIVRADRARRIRQALVGVVEFVVRFHVASLTALKNLLRDLRPRHRGELRGKRTELERRLEVDAFGELVDVSALKIHPALVRFNVLMFALRADQAY